MLLLLAQTPDLLGGSAGWVGTGLLGAVLYWLTFVHLPAKDRQTRDLLTMQTAEREKESISRHQMSDRFQQIVSEIEKDHRNDMISLFARDDKRDERIITAILQQTASQVAATGQQTEILRQCIIAGACKFRGDAPCPLIHSGGHT